MKTIILVICLSFSFHSLVEGEVIRQAFLNSTVVTSYQIGPEKSITGTGFLVYREVEFKGRDLFLGE